MIPMIFILRKRQEQTLKNLKTVKVRKQIGLWAKNSIGNKIRQFSLARNDYAAMNKTPM